MARHDRIDRSVSTAMETFLTSTGSVSWGDPERAPVLRTELERVRDQLVDQDADFPPEDAGLMMEGDVPALLRDYERERREPDV